MREYPERALLGRGTAGLGCPERLHRLIQLLRGEAVVPRCLAEYPHDDRELFLEQGGYILVGEEPFPVFGDQATAPIS